MHTRIADPLYTLRPLPLWRDRLFGNGQSGRAKIVPHPSPLTPAMSINKLALIRYKAIDACLANRRRRWTLDDLIEKVSEVLEDREGIAGGVSRRTIQADIQTMRSDKLGYNAPIIITDKKYYTYADPDYTIAQAPINAADLARLKDALTMLRNIAGIGQLADMSGLVARLEHTIASVGADDCCIQLETVEGLRGLEFLEPLYHAIRARQPVYVGYQSFRAQKPATTLCHPYLLKEYRNRWFLFAKAGKAADLRALALDRISSVEVAAGAAFIPYAGVPFGEFFADVIGVTRNASDRAQKVVLELDRATAPYVLTKPLHPSQQVLREDAHGAIVQIDVVVNFELVREVLGFGDGIRVLTPKALQTMVREKLRRAAAQYDEDVAKHTG